MVKSWNPAPAPAGFALQIRQNPAPAGFLKSKSGTALIYHLYKQRKNVDPTSSASLTILLFYTIIYCLPMTLANESYH